MKDLHGGVGVHGGIDLGDGPEITIDELAQPHVVLDSATPRTTTDEEFKVG